MRGSLVIEPLSALQFSTPISSVAFLHLIFCAVRDGSQRCGSWCKTRLTFGLSSLHTHLARALARCLTLAYGLTPMPSPDDGAVLNRAHTGRRLAGAGWPPVRCSRWHSHGPPTGQDDGKWWPWVAGTLDLPGLGQGPADHPNVIDSSTKEGWASCSDLNMDSAERHSLGVPEEMTGSIYARSHFLPPRPTEAQATALHLTGESRESAVPTTSNPGSIDYATSILAELHRAHYCIGCTCCCTATPLQKLAVRSELERALSSGEGKLEGATHLSALPSAAEEG